MTGLLVLLSVATGILFVLAIVFWRLYQRRQLAVTALTQSRDAQEARIQVLLKEKALLEHDSAQGETARLELTERLETFEARIESERARADTASRDLAVMQSRFEAAAERNAEQIRLLATAKTSLTEQFENLAHRIFEQKTKTFDAANQQQIQLLLKPFREQIDAFSRQSREHYTAESKARHLLKDEIGRLKVLNERISEDALNLTNALKGENKTQGNWGEIVLERVLESSGLREGHEYRTQGSYKDAGGSVLRPDVVVFLPQERCVIIDSKVSLVAYEQFTSSSDPQMKASALKQHLASVNAHVKGLSDKGYENLLEERTLDFVLLFMPIEGAFHLALEHDSSFFKKAYDARIIVVGPSTLLATLRTIENIWRTERQQQNAEQIARQAEDLYDKFVGFVTDMEKIGEQLGRTQESWDKAMNKLRSGKGNLIRRAEAMRALGLSPKKTLPPAEDDA